MEAEGPVKTPIPLIAGMGIGFALWVSSRGLVASAHPFEAKSPLILACLFVAGACLGAGWPDRLWVGPLGLYLGQAMGLLGQKVWLTELAPAEPAALGLLFLVPYCLPGLAGAGVGALLADGAAGRLDAWLAGRRRP